MAIIKKFSAVKKVQEHLLGIQNISVQEANLILDEAKNFIKLNRSASKKLDLLRGKTQINLFFEPSTRTQSSFELAGKRLGADVMSMNIVNSAIKKGETLIYMVLTRKIRNTLWQKVKKILAFFHFATSTSLLCHNYLNLFSYL